MKSDRRTFIQGSVLGLGSLMVTNGVTNWVFADEKKNPNKVGVEEVSPVEDLMREHGGLNRILLIYDEALRRIQNKENLDPALIFKSAKIIHDFIEKYHEKLEEEYLFPKLKKAGKMVDLVDILLLQHKAGRVLTQTILSLSTQSHFKNKSDVDKLEDSLIKFIRMYRPHEAREDTVLFPEFKTIVTQKEYDQLGDLFEDREHEMFGKEGFDGVIVQISEIEKALGIYDLSQFTPKT